MDRLESYPLSIAPMMDRSDRHFRFFMRQITRHTLLYTEMITSPAIIHGDRQKLLGFSETESPLVLQLGGDNPLDLAECARIAEDFGYNEINLNVGCPSDRVQNGNFGACLMAKPELVAKITEAIQKAVNLPVSVKHRIGVDDLDSYSHLANFVRIVSSTGVKYFTIHARKAWLQGLSPKENRTVPPLRYHDVYRLKQDFPHLDIEINGGITNIPQVQEHLKEVDAVMIGRAAYDNPFLFATADRDIYGVDVTPPTRAMVVEKMLPYIDYWVGKGLKLNSITRHIFGLFTGIAGAKNWRRYISQYAYKPGAGAEVIQGALDEVSQRW